MPADLSPAVVERLEALADPLSVESLEATPADVRQRLTDSGLTVAGLLREMGSYHPADIGSRYEEIAVLVDERFQSFTA